MLISLHRRLPLYYINKSDLKFNLAGNLLITLLLAVGKQNKLKYFYLTATALANKIVALIFLYTQKHKVGFPVLACDEDKPLDMLWLVDMDPKSCLISHAGFWSLFLFRVSENKARNLGLNPSSPEGRGAVISPLPFFFFSVVRFCVLSPENHSLSQSEPPSIITPLFPGSSRADRQSLFPAKTIANGDVRSFIKLGVIIHMYKMALCWQNQSPGR